jgi:hypothetical protein
MSVHLEMQIEELEEELVAIKAINQKIQLEKNALKEQFSLQGVSQQRELLIAIINFINKNYLMRELDADMIADDFESN